jgi:hypothetical protein
VPAQRIERLREQIADEDRLVGHMLPSHTVGKVRIEPSGGTLQTGVHQPDAFGWRIRLRYPIEKAGTLRLIKVKP